MSFDWKKIDWKSLDSKALLNKQITKVILGGLILVLIMFIMFGGDKKTQTKLPTEKEPTKIMSATDVLNLDEMNKQYLEEKIDDTRKATSKQIKELGSTLDDYKTKLKDEINEDIKRQKDKLLKEIEDQREENRKMQEQIKFLKATMQEAQSFEEEKSKNIVSRISIIEVEHKGKNGFKIPANRFASGVLEHGVDVSTATSSGSNPIPIKIRLEKPGNLPKGFLDKYTECSIRGACIGTLSDERVRIRLESMTCRNIHTDEEIETDLAGYLTDEGGKEGVRGVMVDRSIKMLQNSFIGGVFGGIAATSRKQSSSFWPFGSGPKADSFGTKLQDGVLGGVEASGDRLSKYWIEFAEKVQPVVQVEAGRRVDIHFTQTVTLGEKGIKTKITAQRNKNNANISEESNE
jgi:conjugal transfer pilus assembly protein TraB